MFYNKKRKNKISSHQEINENARKPPIAMSQDRFTFSKKNNPENSSVMKVSQISSCLWLFSIMLKVFY